MLKTLWDSRKFRITFYDILVAIVLHFGAEYLPANIMADVNWFILAAQPVLISLILGIAIEDNGTNSNPALLTPSEPVTPPVTVNGVPIAQFLAANTNVSAPVTQTPASMVDPAVPPVG
jgi:hypothetical protein